MQPILFIDETLVFYRRSSFIFYNTKTNDYSKVALELGLKEKVLPRFRLIYRMFRLGIRNALQYGNQIIFYVNKRFYEYNLQTNKLIPGFVPPVGIRALNLTHINAIEGFDDMIVFGGYLSNSSKRSVYIYKRISAEQWHPIFSFKRGEVNHIHNIIPDKTNNCVWILTGDFDNSAGIWMAKDNFTIVKPILIGNQSYRSCVAFPIDGNLLYATDSPLVGNSIRMLEYKSGKWNSRKLIDISGSCIYGCKVNNFYIFSTCVEPSGLDKGVKALLSTQKGPGIKDVYCHLYIGNHEYGFKDIYKVKKDIFPYALFQFGALQFPAGINNNGLIVFYHLSTRKDGRWSMLNISNF